MESETYLFDTYKENRTPNDNIFNGPINIDFRKQPKHVLEDMVGDLFMVLSSNHVTKNNINLVKNESQRNQLNALKNISFPSGA